MAEYISKDRLLEERRKAKYYHLPNGDTAIPIIDIEHAPTEDVVEREKIDKAINEIKNSLVYDERNEFLEFFSIGLKYALDVIKSNIGE